VVTSSLTAVGTITTGVWNAGAVTSSGLLTVNAAGSHKIGAGGTGGTASTLTIDGSSAGGAGSYVGFSLNSVPKDFVGTESGVIGGTSANLVVYAGSTFGTKFYTNGALSWGINSAGDFTFGSSSNISESVGTPSIASGFGTSASVTGKDYAFQVSTGTTGSTTGTINFGHTWSNAPICVATRNATDGGTVNVTSSTTQLTMAFASSIFNLPIYVQCKSF
jgi:hypothetical protein